MWKFHVIEQTQLRRQHRVDGVGRPKFDLHTGADDDRSRDDATAPLLSVAANVWAAQGTTSLTSCVFWPFASQPPDDAVDAGPDAEEGGGHEDDDAAAVYLGRGRFCAALGAAGETLARSTTPRDRAAAWIAAGRALVGMARYVEARVETNVASMASVDRSS